MIAEAEDRGRRVLVSGSTGTIGRMLCHELYHDPEVERVIALGRDERPYYYADFDPARFRYHQVDILKPRQLSNLFLSRAFVKSRIDSVVHLAFLKRAGKPGEHGFEEDVDGTKAFLDRCLEVETVRSFTFLSGSLVYKLRPHNSVYIDEDSDLNFDVHADPWTRARVDADMICRARMDHERAAVTVLRAAPIVGRNISSHLNDLLSSYLVTRSAGYDPMVRPVHAWDVVRAFRTAIRLHRTGVFNIAGLDVAPLSEFVRLSGRLTVALPTPVLRRANALQRFFGLTHVNLSAAPDWLRYPCLLDTTRAERKLDFVPRHHVKFG